MTPVRARTRKAVVLMAVLVVVVLLTLAAYKYSDYMLSEYRANEASIRASQARLNADSGVHYAAAQLVAGLDGNPWDNPGAFQSVTLGNPDANGVQNGRFTILSLRSPEETQTGTQAHVFGCQDEASKINVNGLLALDKGKGEIGKKILLKLPNMTEDVAAAILDWMDPDDEPRPSGAENEYYSILPVPYRCKNGPLDSLEELLLVRGVTPLLLFGNDKNRNGRLDPDEQGMGIDGHDQGWSAYLTVYSREANADSTGKARVNVNGSDLTLLPQQLTDAVGSDLAYFILAYKLYGAASTSTSASAALSGRQTALAPADSSAVIAKVQQDLEKIAAEGNAKPRKTNRIRSVWSLANATVQVEVGSGKEKKKVSFPSPLMDPAAQAELLPVLLDKCTTSDRTDLRPRVNVLTASPTVLYAIKEAVRDMTDAHVQAILDKRPTPDKASDPLYRTAAWLLTDVQLPPEVLRRMDSHFTGRTQVYRIQSVGYSVRGGPTARVEAVIDTNMGRPRVVYWRDLSELGRGFELSGE